MEIALLVVQMVLSWVILMIVIPLAGRIADFGYPGPKEAAWKLAVVVVVTSLVSFLLAPVIGLWATVLNFVIFWTAMFKWFQVGLWGAIIIVVVSFCIQFVLSIVLAMLFSSLG